jgi:hypothetical protein
MPGAHICEKKPECTPDDVLTTNAAISTCKNTGGGGEYTRATTAKMNQIVGSQQQQCRVSRDLPWMMVRCSLSVAMNSATTLTSVITALKDGTLLVSPTWLCTRRCYWTPCLLASSQPLCDSITRLSGDGCPFPAGRDAASASLILWFSKMAEEDVYF